MINFEPGIVLQCIDEIDNEIMSTFIVYHVDFNCVIWAHLRYPNKFYKFCSSWKEFLHGDGMSYHVLMKSE